ncbi:DUF3046 domain-containing protein [Agromyces atrinae]|uniref:DUF3046 domain-containing protein n=1 Tax=Agromyces atrinae TaxID=592376 RepID=A0A4Q2M4X2_9MICO|nr:DUF3046 domain-containing protein [Agromyces atrinae]NYD66465.1 hypothetical protein [Agromyces atrinae]RXZ87144.1 DUF3046 domain-containing protein [Agromyces atrinae]
MKLSEFRFAIEHEFGGGYARVLVRDLVLPALGGRTAEDALAAGIAPKDVWIALCDEQGVPLERRAGVGRPDPRRD